MKIVIKEGRLKKIITYGIYICRVLILLSVKIFNNLGWLTDDEFNVLLFTLLPMSTLYLVFTIKFIIVRKRYFPAGSVISNSYFIAGLMPLVLLHLTELALIYFKNAVNSDNYELLYWWVAIIESLLAVYAGFYLSDLFNNQVNRDNTKLSD